MTKRTATLSLSTMSLLAVSAMSGCFSINSTSAFMVAPAPPTSASSTRNIANGAQLQQRQRHTHRRAFHVHNVQPTSLSSSSPHSSTTVAVATRTSSSSSTNKSSTCSRRSNSALWAGNNENNNNGVTNISSDTEDLASRLRAQAAQLRAEAAQLESEKAAQLAEAAQKAFDTFDTNKDGVVSLEELQTGLEKQFETQLSQTRVKELMTAFDASGDNLLQPDEFVTMDRFRNKLNELVRNEKELATKAKLEADAERDAAKLAEARMELLNDAPPTNKDKILSVIPYLFPLMDGLQYGRFLLVSDTAESNPAVTALAVLYALYRSIPLSGFVAFVALNFLSFNPRVNRLVRFNMQQAIFLDIALLFPGLLLGISTAVLPALGVTLDVTSVTEIASDVIFYTLLATLAYTSISSVFGIAPDKIPLISDAVNQRMPNVDMFDDEGRFIGPPPPQDDDISDSTNNDTNKDNNNKKDKP